MAQQFLDLQGLQTLWAKVKEKIQADIQDKVDFTGSIHDGEVIIGSSEGTVKGSGVDLSSLATKSEVSAIPKFAIQVVESLPT